MDDSQDNWLLVDVIGYEPPEPEPGPVSRWAKNSTWMRRFTAAMDAAHNAHHVERGETCLMEKTNV